MDLSNGATNSLGKKISPSAARHEIGRQEQTLNNIHRDLRCLLATPCAKLKIIKRGASLFPASPAKKTLADFQIMIQSLVPYPKHTG